MLGKDAYALLQNDPKRIAKCSGWHDRRCQNGTMQARQQGVWVTWNWGGSEDRDKDWKIFRVVKKKKLRDVFKDPRVGDQISLPDQNGLFPPRLAVVRKLSAPDRVHILRAGECSGIVYTRSEFAARKDWGWKVVSRA